MRDEAQTAGRPDPNAPTAGQDQGDPRLGAPEPWLPMETKLVTYSIVAGIAALIVLAILVHVFILEAH